jgi:hypothetical protein
VTLVPAAPPARARTVEPWEAAAILAGSLALLTASISAVDFLTIPLAVAAIGLAVAAPFLRSRPSKLGAFGPLAGAGVGAFVLLGAWLWPQWFGIAWVRGRADGPAADKPYFVPAGSASLTKPEPLGPDDWIDADQGAWRQGEVQVRVAAVQVVRGQPAGTSDSRTARSNLAVRMKVTNIGASGTVNFTGWGKSGAAKLRDGQTRDCPARGSATGPPSKGAAAPPASLGPRSFAEEVLLFEAPPATADELFLQLSLAPLGAEGSLRFKIGKTMFARKLP